MPWLVVASDVYSSNVSIHVQTNLFLTTCTPPNNFHYVARWPTSCSVSSSSPRSTRYVQTSSTNLCITTRDPSSNSLYAHLRQTASGAHQVEEVFTDKINKLAVPKAFTPQLLLKWSRKRKSSIRRVPTLSDSTGITFKA